jgi:hypothetical protein
MLRRLLVAVSLIVASTSPVAAQVQGGPIPVPHPLFPMNNWWNTDVSSAPLDANSANYITFIGVNRQVHPDFGGDSGDPEFPIYGIPYIIVDGAQAKKTVTFTWPDESDGSLYPIPDQAITQQGWVEGGAPGNVNQREDSDRHILIVDKTNNHLYELFNVWHNGTGWEAGSGAFFDMNTNNRRPEGWTSADAAGLAILPGLVRYDEVYGPDEIRHAFRVTVRATNGHTYPASHTAGSTPGALKLGARLRLKASKDISAHPAEIQRIFRALKKYGLIVADNGSDMYVSGSYDTRWNNDILNPAFHSLKASDFEVIQEGWAPPVSFTLSLPAAVGSGDNVSATLTAYGPQYNVNANYTGTVQFTSTDPIATVPLNYTFTPGDAGVHTFPAGFTLRTVGSQTVTVTDMADPTITLSRNVTVGPPTPQGLVATTPTPASIHVSWSASTGATQYEIVRAASANTYTALTTTSNTSYVDSTVTSGAVYAYKVKAVDAAARSSSFSAPDAATTIAFTDDPVTAMVTVIKSVHFAQLREAVSAMRSTAGLEAMAFTDPALLGLTAKAIHVQELRTALNQARATLGLSATTYTDPTLTAGTSIVRAAHVEDLRTGVK